MQPTTSADGTTPPVPASGLGAGDDVAALVLHLATEINSQADLASILQTVTDTAATLAGARYGAFFYNAVDDEGDSYVLHVVSGPDAGSIGSLPDPRITPLFEPTFLGEGTIRVDDLLEDDRYAGLSVGHLPVRSYLATPVVARDGGVIGAVLLGHPDPGVFTDRAESAVRLVAVHAAVAVQNARLFGAQREALELAEERTQSLVLLQEITSRLAGMFTVDDAIDGLVGTLSRHLGIKRMGVYRLEQGQLRALRSRSTAPGGAVAGSIPAWAEAVDPVNGPDRGRPALGLGGQDLAHFSSVPLDAPTPSGDALRHQELVCIPDRETLVSCYPGLASATPGVNAVAAVPLRVFDADYGVLALSWPRSMVFGRERRELLAAVGEQLSGTLERIELFASAAEARSDLRRHVEELTEASQTLQRSLLPADLPPSDAVEVEVRYAPGAKNAEVGGDWYDMVVTPSGRVTLVIGDVQGHSFSAAAVMGRVSTALHAYLLEGHALDVALTRVNPIAEQSGLLVTCCLVSLDPLTGEVSIARAGHPVPLFRRGTRVAQMAEEGGGPPLGVSGADARWEVRTGWAQPGDRLLLFTDGLIERSDVDMDTQVQSLLDLLDAQGDFSLPEAADTILSGMDPVRGDDVALLIADYHGMPGPPPRASAGRSLLVADLASVARARRFTEEMLVDWGLGAARDTAVLVVSEMVTNALLHAEGPATLELVPAEDRVRIQVSDQAAQGPEAQSTDLDAEHGRGVLLIDTLALDWGVDPHGFGKMVWAEVALD